jgi:hypothetical protein
LSSKFPKAAVDKKVLAKEEAICYNGTRIMKKYTVPAFIVIAAALFLALGNRQTETLLEGILERAGESRRRGDLPVVIFDLDGTLFHTGFRSKHIFLEYAQENGDSLLVSTVRSLDPLTMKYRVRESLVAAGITDSTVVKAMIDSWRLKFFSDEYLEYDEHLAGSVKFTNALHDSGALIIYLTGRDVQGMLLGTTSSLTEHGFPVGIARTELIMKPERYMKTHRFKKDALSYIDRLGTVIAVFENEPEYLNLLSDRFPVAVACFIETQHKPNAPPLTETAHRIEHYVINLPLMPTGSHMEKTE